MTLANKLIAGITIVVIAAVLFTLLSASADPDERYDAGYSDGYAVGFNTTCEIRATLIEGDWDNKDCSRGNAVGNDAGSIACLRSKEH